MAQVEEHVDFVPKPGVTIYIGSGRWDHDPNQPVKLPKSVADELTAAGYRHAPEVPAATAAVSDNPKPAAVKKSDKSDASTT